MCTKENKEQIKTNSQRILSNLVTAEWNFFVQSNWRLVSDRFGRNHEMHLQCSLQ